MMEKPKTSTDNTPVPRNISITQEIQTNQDDDDASVNSREIYAQRLDTPDTQTENIAPKSVLEIQEFNAGTSRPLVLKRLLPITNQPLRISSNLPSHASLNITSSNQPQTLFLQALAKLNESSLSLAMTDRMSDPQAWLSNTNYCITPPDSMTSAPPSYSFVLRQMAVRRRPRLMGTFIPSPSYIQHTPPPNYATAFDIYVDSPMPPQPTRVYHFGFTPVTIVCPECGHTGMTVVASKITLCTHLCAVILCLLCCWICAPLPYVLRSCKDVYHYCRNCRNFLGMYCPTNPESAYVQTSC